MTKQIGRLLLIVSSLLFLLSSCATGNYQKGTYLPKSNLASTIREYQPLADSRLKPHFAHAGVAYPPRQAALLAFKQDRRMELWARNGGGSWRYIRSYPILAAGGGPGPKLHAGDNQVPEGIYHIVALNPNSHYHLSMGLDYPNTFDRLEARRDGRSHLGGDIFIHGSNLSIGCLAMGDRTIEELFVLAYETGLSNVEVIIAPDDLRHEAQPANGMRTAWLPQLYNQLRAALSDFS